MCIHLCTFEIIIIVPSRLLKYPMFLISPLDARVQGFYEALIKHVHQMVIEHEGISDDLKEWVLTQALSSKELQNRGTFQHVLSQKMDDVIEPKFAEILAFIDTNHNLDLISGQCSAVSRLWISFFSNPHICHFSYEELAAKSRQRIPAAEEFRCQFPFSWLVRQSVEEAWSTAKNTAGKLHDFQISLFFKF